MIAALNRPPSLGHRRPRRHSAGTRQATGGRPHDVAPVAAGVLAALLALAVAGATAWDASSGGRLPVASLAVGCLFVVGAAVAGELFLRWRDGLMRNYLQLARRRVVEFEESSDAIFILNDGGGIEALNGVAERMLKPARNDPAPAHRRGHGSLRPGDAPFVDRVEAANGPLAAAGMRELAVRGLDGGRSPPTSPSAPCTCLTAATSASTPTRHLRAEAQRAPQGRVRLRGQP